MVSEQLYPTLTMETYLHVNNKRFNETREDDFSLHRKLHANPLCPMRNELALALLNKFETKTRLPGQLHAEGNG